MHIRMFCNFLAYSYNFKKNQELLGLYMQFGSSLPSLSHKFILSG